MSASPTFRETPRDLPVHEDESAFLRCVTTRTPCVMRGLARRWPAVERWTFASLSDHAGDDEVDVAELEGRRLAVDARAGVRLRRDSFGSVLGKLSRGDDASYVMTRLEPLRGLHDDLRPPEAWSRARFRSSKLWVSPAGAVSPLHFDVSENIHVQITGRKRFILVPTRDTRGVYPSAPWSSTPNFSRVDLSAPDFRRFPRLAGVKRWQSELSPGDAVFIPGLVWHHVTTLEPSISVNYWWSRGLLSLAARGADAFKRLRAISR